ncbi:MAG: hypothetical protein ABFD97_08680 [Syntrophobacter sp.]
MGIRALFRRQVSNTVLSTILIAVGFKELAGKSATYMGEWLFNRMENSLPWIIQK